MPESDEYLETRKLEAIKQFEELENLVGGIDIESVKETING